MTIWHHRGLPVSFHRAFLFCLSKNTRPLKQNVSGEDSSRGMSGQKTNYNHIIGQPGIWNSFWYIFQRQVMSCKNRYLHNFGAATVFEIYTNVVEIAPDMPGYTAACYRCFYCGFCWVTMNVNHHSCCLKQYWTYHSKGGKFNGRLKVIHCVLKAQKTVNGNC